METLVSIITPAYNCEEVLQFAVSSVKEQSYSFWEHIIIDDASSDDTRAAIEKFAIGDQRIKAIFLDNNVGVANARNKGINVAKGKYIAFLDSDDLWKPEKLEKQIAYMEKNNCDFVFSDYEIIGERGNLIGVVYEKKRKIDYKTLLRFNRIGCLTVIVRNEILKKTLMPDMGHEDYATWLTILKNHVNYAEKVDGILASYRLVKGSVSSNKPKSIIWNWKIYRNNQGLGYLKSLKGIVEFSAFASIKYLKSRSLVRSKFNE